MTRNQISANNLFQDHSAQELPPGSSQHPSRPRDLMLDARYLAVTPYHDKFMRATSRTGHPLDRIRIAAAMQREVDQVMLLAVENARAQGESWQHIGDELGVSKQAAWEMYRYTGESSYSTE